MDTVRISLAPSQETVRLRAMLLLLLLLLLHVIKMLHNNVLAMRKLKVSVSWS